MWNDPKHILPGNQRIIQILTGPSTAASVVIGYYSPGSNKFMSMLTYTYVNNDYTYKQERDFLKNVIGWADLLPADLNTSGIPCISS